MKGPFAEPCKVGKGIFQQATHETGRERITLKFGSDLVVEENQINRDLLHHVATQVRILGETGKDAIIVTSGATKYGRILGRENGQTLSKREAAFVGFDELMAAWQAAFSEVGLLVITLALTGQSFTQKQSRQLQERFHADQSTFIVNTHDGLNLPRYRYHNLAANNDQVGERLADLSHSHTYIICTNVDGVLDSQNAVISHIQSWQQLNELRFYQNPEGNGTGGMKTKLHSALRHAQSAPSRVSYIVNGREENVLLKVMSGEEVGTRIKISEENMNGEMHR